MSNGTPHEIALQAVAELDRGLTVADLEVRKAQFGRLRATMQSLRICLEVLDKTLPLLTDREGTGRQQTGGQG